MFSVSDVTKHIVFNIIHKARLCFYFKKKVVLIFSADGVFGGNAINNRYSTLGLMLTCAFKNDSIP